MDRSAVFLKNGFVGKWCLQECIFMMVFAELYCCWGSILKYFQDEKAKDVFNLAVKRMCIYTQELEMGQVNSSIRTGVFDGECSVVYTFLLLHEITGEEKYLSYAEKHLLS